MHPYGLMTDDCVKRAIAVTTGLDYMDVQRGLNAHKKITGAKKFNESKNPDSYVENVLGFAKVKLPKKNDGSRIKADEFCAAHPKGRFILTMSGHWTACVNGVILDTWDCGSREVYSFFCISPLVSSK